MTFDRHHEHECREEQADELNAPYYEDAYGHFGGHQGGGGGGCGSEVGPGGSNLGPGGYNMGPGGPPEYNMGPGGPPEYNMGPSGPSEYNMGPGGSSGYNMGQPDLYSYDGGSSGPSGPGGSQISNNFYANGNTYNCEGQGGSGSGVSQSNLLLNKVLSDPSMYSVMQNAQSQMTSTGFAQFESLATQDLSSNPYTPDSQLLSSIATQMQQSGDNSDASVLSSYAQPGALNTAASFAPNSPENAASNSASTPETNAPYTDSYIQSLQNTDPQLGTALSDAYAAMLSNNGNANAFQALETYVQNTAGGSTSDAQVLTNYANWLSQHNDQPDASSLQAIVEADLPSTTANDTASVSPSADSSMQPADQTLGTASGAPGTTDALTTTSPGSSVGTQETSATSDASQPSSATIAAIQADQPMMTALNAAQSEAPSVASSLQQYIIANYGTASDSQLFQNFITQNLGTDSQDPNATQDATALTQIASQAFASSTTATNAAGDASTSTTALPAAVQADQPMMAALSAAASYAPSVAQALDQYIGANYGQYSDAQLFQNFVTQYLGTDSQDPNASQDASTLAQIASQAFASSTASGTAGQTQTAGTAPGTTTSLAGAA